MRGPAVIVLLLAVVLPATPVAASSLPIDHVIIVSVDGLRSDALLAPDAGTLPAFDRLRYGPGTLNARTIPNATVTMPNHVSMVTGRLMDGPDGHGWRANALTRLVSTVHSTAGGTVQSVFDVAASHDVRTAAFVSKRKLILLPMSWDSIDDFVDVTELTDDARLGTSLLADELVRVLAAGHERTLSFVHFAEPDMAGHTAGWDLTEGSMYLQSIGRVDAALLRILTLIDRSPALRGRTAIIVTSDHGGGAPHLTHTRSDMWVNYIIPFLVWTGMDAPPRELYAASPTTRSEPGLRQPGLDATAPPIRNADAANVALQLLGLPPVTGSTVGFAQDLVVVPERPRWTRAHGPTP